ARLEAEIQRKSAKAALGKIGTSGRESAEKPPGSLRNTWDSWDIGMHGVRKADSAEGGKNCLSLASGSQGQLGQEYTDRPVWRKSVHFGRVRKICPRQSRTVGTRVRRGCELAGLAKIEDFHLGHPGRKYARD
ncbi:hypothetical protein KI387_019862, partial [Taxus chinensis]